MKRFVSAVLLAAIMLTAAMSFGCSKKDDKPALKDGDYAIEVDSSSSMFNIVKCTLHVKDGKMTADLTMSGQGYGALFMGKADKAPAKPDESCSFFILDEDGAKVFTIPVEALDKDIDCAAWSIKKETWYDRVLVFKSESLPENAFNK